MSEQGNGAAPKYEKGARAAIVSGKKDVGVRGQVFWIGPNKYGPGFRYGLRGDDGATYWVDEGDLGAEAAAPPAPAREGRPPLEKGARVTLTAGKGAGTPGEVFWVGESRYGQGMRYGVKDDQGETHWVDEAQVEPSDAPAPPAAKGAGARPSRGGARGAPAPRDDFASEFSDEPPPALPGAGQGDPHAPPPFDDEGWPSDDDFVAEGEDEDLPF